jgi:hypothetical protein
VKKSFLFLVLIIASFMQVGSAQNDSSHLRISVLTCAQGEELYSVFGHTAIRIIDSTRQTDIVYNYGTFDFGDPDFYTKFTRGKLDYFLSASTLPEFMYEYQSEKRDVTEQVLRLTADTKLLIAKALSANLMGTAKYYKYDFQYNNCTSRVRDILMNYGGLQADRAFVPAKTTFRNMLHEYLDRGGKPWSKLGIDLLLGSRVDKTVNNKDAMFLPNYLMKGIDSSVHNTNGGILAEKNKLNYGVSNQPPNPNWPLYIFSIAAILIASISFIPTKTARVITHTLDFVLFLITGLIGCLVLFMWFGTDHKACSANYNLLWALPTHLIAAFALWKNPGWLRKYFNVCTIVSAVTLLLWFWLPQQLNMGFIPVILLLLQRCWQLGKPTKPSA